MKQLSKTRIGGALAAIAILSYVIAFQNCGGSSGSGGVAAVSPGSSSSSSSTSSGGSSSGGSGLTATTVSNAVTFMGSNLDTPDAIAVDGNGNVLVGNWNLTGVTRIQPSSATTNCSAGCTAYVHITAGVYGGLTSNILSLAVDPSNNVWIPGVNFMEITSGGVVQQLIAANNRTFGDFAAVEASGNMWSSAVNETNAAGAALSSYSLPANTLPTGIAIDSANHIWVSVSGSTNTGNVIEYPAGTSYSGGGLVSPSDLALDSSGNVWVVNDNSGMGTGVSSVTEIQAGASSNCSSGCMNFTNGALATAEGVAIDGANNVWIAGGLTGTIVKITPGAASDCSTGCTAYTISSLVHPTKLAIDSAGNVWIADEDANAIVEFPALAASTITPLALQTR